VQAWDVADTPGDTPTPKHTAILFGMRSRARGCMIAD